MNQLSKKNLKYFQQFHTLSKRNIFLGIISVVSIIALLYISSIGQYVRPMTDDYLFTSNVHDPARAFQFGINGRYSTALVYGLGYSIPGFLTLVPLVSIFFCFTAIYLLMRVTLSRYSLANPRLTNLAMSLVLTLAVCLVVPGLYSSIFWFSAAPVHTWSVGFLLVYIAYLYSDLNSKHTTMRYTILALLGLFISIMNEIVTTLLFTIMFCTIVCLLLYYKSKTQKVNDAVIGLVTSLIGILILFFSPGAMSRRAAVSQGTDSSFADRLLNLPAVLYENLYVHIPSIINNPWVLLGIFVFGLVMSVTFFRIKKLSIKEYLMMSLLPLTFCVLVIFINITVVYIGAGALPPLRAHFITTIALVLAWFMTGFIVGQFWIAFGLKSITIAYALGVSLTLLTIITGLESIHYIQQIKYTHSVHADYWDDRDRTIENAINSGNCPVRVRSLPLPDIADIQPEPDTWTNKWMQAYYGSSPEKSCQIVGF